MKYKQKLPGGYIFFRSPGAVHTKTTTLLAFYVIIFYILFRGVVLTPVTTLHTAKQTSRLANARRDNIRTHKTLASPLLLRRQALLELDFYWLRLRTPSWVRCPRWLGDSVGRAVATSGMLCCPVVGRYVGCAALLLASGRFSSASQEFLAWQKLTQDFCQFTRIHLRLGRWKWKHRINFIVCVCVCVRVCGLFVFLAAFSACLCLLCMYKNIYNARVLTA